jgi:hypothetical protein
MVVRTMPPQLVVGRLLAVLDVAVLDVAVMEVSVLRVA